MEARAEARYLRTSPQKARLVVDLIRGQQAGHAITILRATNKRIAPTVEKVLKSAIANAKNMSENVDVDELYVSEAYVNEGPRVKRIRPAPMGRAYRYQRRMSHIVVKVAQRNPPSRNVPRWQRSPPCRPAATAISSSRPPGRRPSATPCWIHRSPWRPGCSTTTPTATTRSPAPSSTASPRAISPGTTSSTTSRCTG